MKRLGNFLHLTAGERCLLVSTALLLAAIRLGLRLLPFRILRRVLIRLAQASSAGTCDTNRYSADRLVWAVTVASHYVPKATCLTQALAAQVLLGRRGHLTQLRVGVAKDEEGQLEAHAWLESQGKVIVGGGELTRYTLLPNMG